MDRFLVKKKKHSVNSKTPHDELSTTPYFEQKPLALHVYHRYHTTGECSHQSVSRKLFIP